MNVPNDVVSDIKETEASLSTTKDALEDMINDFTKQAIKLVRVVKVVAGIASV